MLNDQFEPGSFRDRNGRVFYRAGCVYRGLSNKALREWEALSSTQFFKRFSAEEKLVQTKRVESPKILDSSILGKWAAVLKHDGIPFISYPYEWSFEMLKDAALLELELLLAALEDDSAVGSGQSGLQRQHGHLPLPPQVVGNNHRRDTRRPLWPGRELQRSPV